MLRCFRCSRCQILTQEIYWQFVDGRVMDRVQAMDIFLCVKLIMEAHALGRNISGFQPNEKFKRCNAIQMQHWSIEWNHSFSDIHIHEKAAELFNYPSVLNMVSIATIATQLLAQPFMSHTKPQFPLWAIGIGGICADTYNVEWMKLSNYWQKLLVSLLSAMWEQFNSTSSMFVYVFSSVKVYDC